MRGEVRKEAGERESGEVWMEGIPGGRRTGSGTWGWNLAHVLDRSPFSQLVQSGQRLLRAVSPTLSVATLSRSIGTAAALPGVKGVSFYHKVAQQ